MESQESQSLIPSVLCEFGPDRNQLVLSFRNGKQLSKTEGRNAPIVNLRIMEKTQLQFENSGERYRKRILLTIN